MSERRLDAAELESVSVPSLLTQTSFNSTGLDSSRLYSVSVLVAFATQSPFHLTGLDSVTVTAA